MFFRKSFRGERRVVVLEDVLCDVEGEQEILKASVWKLFGRRVEIRRNRNSGGVWKFRGSNYEFESTMLKWKWKSTTGPFLPPTTRP